MGVSDYEQRSTVRCRFCGGSFFSWRAGDHGRCRVNAGHPLTPRPDVRTEDWVRRYRRIVAMRSDGMTLEAIGNEFGIGRERVRQILKRPPPVDARRSGRPAALLADIDVLMVAACPQAVVALDAIAAV